MEDETVVEAIPSIGFIHRGLEKLVEKKEFTEYVYVAERICGICSFMHGMGYCQSIENGMKLQIARRAENLRVVWAELSRVHSHLLWLGLLADSFGFESLFMHTWRMREKILDIFEATTGGRVIFSVCKVGGVRRDMDNQTLQSIVKSIDDMEAELREVTDVFIEDYTVKTRMVGVGVMNAQEAHDLGACGPMGRGSGLYQDMRLLGYSAYDELDFKPVVETAGYCYARTVVRIGEVYQAFDLIRQAVSKIPDGDVSVPVTDVPRTENFERLEQPRGEVIYYTKGIGTKLLERARVRTPTFANIPPLLHCLKGCDLADVPVIILSIDPCISCTER
jgi:ech hydrogenase subunit E